jgi:hypothetical protein
MRGIYFFKSTTFVCYILFFICGSMGSTSSSLAASSSTERELQLVQQQLSLKDEIIAELRSKHIIIAAKDKLYDQEPLAQQPDSLASASDDTTAQRLAAAEARLQQLEAAAVSANGSRSRSEAVSKQRRVRRKPGYTPPLEKDEVLDEIFSFVGRKEWLYAGAVCRRWRGRYLSMCYKARGSNDEHAFQTSHRSSFVTAARFSIALQNGLHMPNADEASKFFDDLPSISQQPIKVLTLARVHGAAWTEELCRAAAYFGDFKLLKWLHSSGCPWYVPEVAIGAIRGQRRDYELILPWLLSTEAEWSQECKDDLLAEAGGVYDVKAMELMIDQGAEWPSSFTGKHYVLEENVNTCWNYEAVRWALSKSCSWGLWRCQDLAPELYTDDGYRVDAIDLFEWAHENDCPCTCEAAAADDAVVAA